LAAFVSEDSEHDAARKIQRQWRVVAEKREALVKDKLVTVDEGLLEGRESLDILLRLTPREKFRKAVRKITLRIALSKSLSEDIPDHDPLPCDRKQAIAVVGAESVYLNSEMQEILEFRLDQIVTAETATNAEPTAPKKGVKKVSFSVGFEEMVEVHEQQLDIDAPERPRRSSLGFLGEGEQRVELLRRLRHGDLELVRLMEEQERISKGFKRLKEEEHACYEEAKVGRLADSLTDMIDVHRVATDRDSDRSQECLETRAKRTDLQRESWHWQKEADRLWWQVQALRNELEDRQKLYRQPT